ncbi:hypothetical protein IMZ48_35975, partial [Candidatus Bathyarchaeota archaeon]|nr:hypothetical protein [Candidatus Bathyarchaeota archaeon]
HEKGLLRERASAIHRLGTVRFIPQGLRSTDDPPGAAACGLHLRKVLQSAAETFRENMLTRCWLIQELILSRRLLVWGGDQVYWTCRTHLWSEGSALAGDPSWVKYLPPPEEAPASPNGISMSHLTWYSFVQLYSKADITFAKDRLVALKAFVAQFEKKSIQSAYAAGLWTDDIANGLLWYVNDLKTKKPYGDPPAPTWSWASINGRVTYCLLRGTRTDKISDENHRLSLVEASRAKVIQTLSSVRDEVDPVYVKLDATTLDDIHNRDQPYRQQLLECEYYFDCSEYEKRFRDGGDDGGEGGGGGHTLMFHAHVRGAVVRRQRWAGGGGRHALHRARPL